MSKARAFCFTLNNPSITDETNIEALDYNYLVYGREIAPTTGTAHLQGYIQFKNPRGVKAIGGLFKWHVEPAKGDSKVNYDYCTKSGNYVEKGARPKTKKEAAILGGEEEKKIWGEIILQSKLGTLEAENPKIYFTHYRTAEALRVKHQQTVPVPTLDKPAGTFYIGPTGCGKSRTAREENPGAYIKNCNKWWDGYNGQECVIMDDLDPLVAKALSHHIKIWLDHYPFTAEIKGGSIFIRPKRIIITTQYSLDKLFEDPEVLAAIKRRSTLWIANPDNNNILELQ